MPLQVQISEKDVVNGRAFPTMLIWLMLAMSALLLGREAYNMVMHRPAKTKTLNLLVEAKALVIILFPLQEAPLLRRHRLDGGADLGRVPLRAEC